MSGSGPSDHNHWLQFYHQNQLLSSDHGVSDSTVVTTTTATVTSDQSTVPSPVGTGNINRLSPEGRGGGRISKPVRRRSRVSRRTPTTLLNTDTTNFRAMVQQFTGGSAAPFAAGSHPGSSSFGAFGLSGPQLQPPHMMINPTTSHGAHVMMGLPNHGNNYNINHLQPHEQQQLLNIQHHNQQQFMFPLSNPSSSGDGFYQRLGGSRSTRPVSNLGLSDGFLMENNNSDNNVNPPTRPAHDSSNSSFLH